MPSAKLPKTQHAVQLVGPDRLEHNPAKEIPRPGPRQILAKVEAVGLCFSDLKLLKQFDQHVRKAPVVKGLTPEVLREIPSYVPESKPTVPGHEVVCRIIEVGNRVERHKVGERCIVQADWRQIRTPGSNAAFGYNFEGGLQEYVLLDERVVIDPGSGERFLIPVEDGIGASAVALVEPWACVEDSYVTTERQSIKAHGRLLVVADAGRLVKGLKPVMSGAPARLVAILADNAQRNALDDLGVPVETAADVTALADESFDDIVYFGADKNKIEKLNDKLAANGIINIVLGGRQIGAPVSVGVGRVHYGMTRWIGTEGDDAASAYSTIPANGEIRPGDSIAVIGAGGPMGQMHVIRNVCSGMKDITVVATDVDDARLQATLRKAQAMAQANGVELRMANSREQPLSENFSYYAIMAPMGALIADAIRHSLPGCIINIFAGIPAPTRHELDLDTYIARQCFMFGTSGSTIMDMKIVLAKVQGRSLNTNASVDAIAGMAGATEGIRAVENRTMAGKIIVYPMLHDVGLIPLADLKRHYPTVAAKLNAGQWSEEAEAELLRVAGAQ